MEEAVAVSPPLSVPSVPWDSSGTAAWRARRLRLRELVRDDDDEEDGNCFRCMAGASEGVALMVADVGEESESELVSVSDSSEVVSSSATV